MSTRTSWSDGVAMAALVASIHVFLAALAQARRGWPGRSPAMTMFEMMCAPHRPEGNKGVPTAFLPSPCGEGSGVGIGEWGTLLRHPLRPPTPTLPHKGGKQKKSGRPARRFLF